MFAKILVAAAALTAAVSVTAPAQAKTNIDIGVGLGFGFGGGYDGGYYGGGYYPVYNGGYNGISCGTARKIVKSQGFYNVKPTDCGGYIMRFKAWQGGEKYRVKVNRKGHIVDVDHI